MDWHNLPDVDKLTETELRAELRARRAHNRIALIVCTLAAIAGCLFLLATLFMGEWAGRS